MRRSGVGGARSQAEGDTETAACRAGWRTRVDGVASWRIDGGRAGVAVLVCKTARRSCGSATWRLGVAAGGEQVVGGFRIYFGRSR